MRVLLTTVLFLFVQLNVSAQSMDKFWELFKANDYEPAIEELEKVTKNEPDNEDALAMLIVLYNEKDYPEKAFETFSRLYHKTTHKNEYLRAFWHTTAVTSFGKEQAEERIAFLNAVIADPVIDGALKAMAHSRIGNYLFATNEVDDHFEEIAKIGNINKWQMVGSFQNISASGFDKDYEPIHQPKANAKFLNKHDAPVFWINSEVFRVGEWTRTSHHFAVSSSIVYVQTFIKSDIETAVQFRLGTAGSVKGWVNDELILSEEEEYNNGIDTYRSNATLKAGWNRVLIQLGTSELSTQNFMLRITDEQGNPIEGLTVDNSFHDYPVVGGENVNRIPLKAEAYFEKRVKEAPKNLINHILLSRCYLDNGKNNQAHSSLKKAEKLAPENSLVLWQMIQLYLKQDNETELGTATEKLKKVDPDNDISQMLEFNEAIGNEDYEKAEKIRVSMQEKGGNSSSDIKSEIKLEQAKGNNQKVIDLALKGYEKYPDDYEFVQYKYTIELKVNQNAKAAQKVLKKYMKNNYSSDVQKLYATSWYERGNLERFFIEYEKILEIIPYAYSTILDLADINSQINRKHKALEYLDMASTLAPFEGNSYYQKGEIYLEMDEVEKARENFELAVLYDPRDFSSRERIREIDGLKSPFDEFEEKDYYEIYKNGPDASEYPEDNSVILTEETQIVIHSKGAVEEKVHTVIKVFDKAGVDFWKEQSIPYNGSQYLNVEKAEVLKADGSKSLAEVSGGYVVFTKLEPGDGIYLSYKKQNYYQGSLAEHFWGKQYFDYFVPAENIEFAVFYDEKEIPLTFKTANGEIQKEEKTIDGKKLVRWYATDCPSIKSESFMPALTDVGRVLHYTTMPDWKFVSDWYSDLSATKAKVDYEVKEAVQELYPDGWEGISDEEKIRTVYEYIVNEIRYSSISFRQSGLIPQKASKVITTKIGDCKDVSTLFVAMCEELDVDAQLVLVNTRERGQKTMELPSINFNHCIAKVNVNGEERFVELTTDLYPFATISSSLEGAFILEIDPDKEDVQPRLLPRNELAINAIYRATTVDVKENELLVEKSSIKTGSIGAGMRNSYRDIGEEQRRKKMQKAITGDYTNVKLEEATFDSSLQDNSDSVLYSYTYTIQNPFTSIGDLQILKLPFAENIKPMDFLSVDNRKFGVELWKYFDYAIAKEILTLKIPEDKQLAEVPKNLSISNEFLDYELSFELKDKTLTVDRSIEFKVTTIPVEKFEDFKRTMDQVIKADELQIGLK
ncbi:MAG: DUF3857 domain-containing protein [Crocinitomicaceae bacterium]